MLKNNLNLTFLKKSKAIFMMYSFMLISILFSCGGSSNQNDNLTLTPSNLVVNTDIVGTSSSNPNGDGSGTVNFNISATNATSYKILLGDGETKEVTNGNFSYTYTTSGTNEFTIYVSAYNTGQFISTSTSITIYVAPTELWSDEFNTDGAPDSSKWGYDLGAGGWGNNESQYYTNRPENVIVQNGILKITAKKESYQGAEYTSTRMKTQGKFSFKYGRVEIRAKLPSGGGTWPALWMLGSNISTVGWPACGEVDIMEHAGNRQGIVQSAMHTPSSYGNTSNLGAQTLGDISTAFHVYAVEWTSEQMVFSVDGAVHYTYNPTPKNSSTWPFDANQFIIFNIAMGGGFGGTIDPAFSQSSMEIDYIRVYN